MISGHCRTALAQVLSGGAIEAISEEDRQHTGVDVNCFNDITDLRHNAFAMSASSNKTASAFHLFRCLFAIKSANNA